MHTSNYIYGMCSWWRTCFNTYMHLKLRRHGMSIHWMSIVEILHDEDIRNDYIYSTIQSLGYKRQYLWRIKLHHQWNEALLPCIEPSQKSTRLEVQWVMNRQSYKILCQDTANTEGRVWILINRNACTNMKLFLNNPGQHQSFQGTTHDRSAFLRIQRWMLPCWQRQFFISLFIMCLWKLQPLEFSCKVMFTNKKNSNLPCSQGCTSVRLYNMWKIYTKIVNQQEWSTPLLAISPTQLYNWLRERSRQKPFLFDVKRLKGLEHARNRELTIEYRAKLASACCAYT